MDFDAYSEDERNAFIMEVTHEAICDAGRLVLVRDVYSDMPSDGDEAQFELGLIDDTTFGFEF